MRASTPSRHVGVAGIEDVIQTEVRQFLEHAAGARRWKARWECSPAGSPRRAGGRTASALRARVKAASNLRMSNSSPPTPMCWIRYRNGMISAISSARLISSTICMRLAFHRLGDGDDGVRAGAAPDLVVVHRRVDRVQLQLGIAEPVAQFGDLRLVAIVQVLARAEDLHGGNSGLLDSARAAPRQPVVDEQVRGQYVIHQVVSVLPRCLRCAGSGAPSSHPLFQRMAAASPCAFTRLTV